MVEPPPGNRPCVFSSWPNRTSALATRMSATRCSLWIMFQASPWTTVIRGLLSCWYLAKGFDIPSSIANGLPVLARDAKVSTSMPREKFLPWPKNTAARRSGSLSKS